MEYTKKIVILIFILIICSNNKYLFANYNSTNDTCKILFIGSSYFNFNDMPDLFRNLANSSGKEVYLDWQIPSGLYPVFRSFSGHPL